ncbi:laccase [Lactifluus subvellereus]|nr:laccase [Lactifluus subvellereus]
MRLSTPYLITGSAAGRPLTSHQWTVSPFPARSEPVRRRARSADGIVPEVLMRRPKRVSTNLLPPVSVVYNPSPWVDPLPKVVLIWYCSFSSYPFVMSQLRSLALLLAAITGSIATVGPDTTLPIVNVNISPDGFPRPATLAGGTFPGPLIQGTKGTEFSINVIDQLTDPSMDLGTSIHWHGIFQNHTNFVDGPAFVTQCPLVPNESFLYQFNAFSQAGTFWYHSHFNNQYCDGLRGAFIIYDPDDPHQSLYDIDNDDTVITLADWYHYLSTNPPAIPSFNSTLINGKGRFPGGPDVPLAIVNVQQGKRYRFRLVSISCEPSFTFSIDGHQMTVIEVEGTNVQSLIIDSLEILAGQRYSVVVNANQPVDNYWIRALPKTQIRTGNFSDLNNLAVFHYAGAPDANPTVDPTANITSKLPLVETNLHPLTPSTVPGKPVPGGADININLDVVINDARTAFLVNGVAFQPPTVPVLLQILSGAKNASQLLPTGSIYGLQPNQSVELTIPGGAIGGPHPVHLHGHAFYVVRSAGNSSYNFVDPIIRDVVSIGNTGDNVTIRFFTDNPGPWFFHCHIDWHLGAGFAAIFAEDVLDVQSQDPTNDAWAKLCPIYNAFLNGTSYA